MQKVLRWCCQSPIRLYVWRVIGIHFLVEIPTFMLPYHGRRGVHLSCAYHAVCHHGENSAIFSWWNTTCENRVPGVAFTGASCSLVNGHHVVSFKPGTYLAKSKRCFSRRLWTMGPGFGLNRPNHWPQKNMEFFANVKPGVWCFPPNDRQPFGDYSVGEITKSPIFDAACCQVKSMSLAG